MHNSQTTPPRNPGSIKSLEESIPRAVLRHLLLDHDVFVGSRVLVVDRHADAWQTWLQQLGVVASTAGTGDLQQNSPDSAETPCNSSEPESTAALASDAPRREDSDDDPSLVDAVLITDPDALFASATEESAASGDSVDLIARLQQRLRAGGQLIALCSPQTQHTEDVEFALGHVDPHPQRREFAPRSWSHPFGDKQQSYRVIGARIQKQTDSENTDDESSAAA